MRDQLSALVERVRSVRATMLKPFLSTLEIYRGLDFWLSSADMAARLKEIDRRIATTPPQDIPRLWAEIPFDVFSLLAFHRLPQYPNLLAFFPAWPSAKVQAETVGATGTKLQFMTNAFIRSLVRGAQAHLPRPLSEARVLDYGVGFGRNVRMLSKYVPAGNLYGVDPFPPNVALCQQLGLKAHIHACDSYPQHMPPALAGTRFDLIFLFSIFTHLSEPTHKRVLHVLHEGLADDGVLVVTVRPREAWDVLESPERERLRQDHDRKGYAFLPIEIAELGTVDGEPTFGESTMSLAYVEQHWTDWRVVDMDLNLMDPYQLILFLKKKSA
ncbi:MAG: class I SAM-dependent methyltransferase [Lentisphaerae bacterium]|nr:class I SAM-dependent methyltransferase [Lentisphaerota bacterium]